MDKRITLDIDIEMLRIVDEYVLKMKYDKPKQHFCRKKIIEAALDSYLKIQQGFFYKKVSRNRQEK